MVDLTEPEIRALLWHIHTVDLAYGQEPPTGTVTGSAKEKLLTELRQRGVQLA